MVEKVDVLEVEDPSVQQLLNKTAKELHKKYNKQRKIKEKLLKKTSPAQKVTSAVMDCFFVLLFLVAFVICFATINTTFNGFMPNMAGYTNIIIASESMVKSGYEVGDAVVIHSVKTDTLKVNDKIAFYVYPFSYIDVDETMLTEIPSPTTKTKYNLTVPLLFGFQTDEVKQAAAIKSDIVFHHIRAIYEDENGERWFKTYGSSNGSDDSWWINEKYVVGIEDNTFVSKAFLGIVSFSAKPYGIWCIAIPAIIMLGIVAFNFLKNVQLAKLELDCVEEKRKITDPICVRNQIGLLMDKKTKYKILAQATEENWNEYIKLLWEEGKMPDEIKKYYMRKSVLLSDNRKLLKLNRECEKMFKEGKKPTKIAQHYLKEKKKIEEKYEETKQRLKLIKKQSNNEKNS